MPKGQNHHKIFSSCSHFSAHHLQIQCKVRVRFPSQHQHKLNSGSIPEFNTKCGFDSCIYDKNFIHKKKIKNSEEQWLLLILKAEKKIQNTIFLFQTKIKLLYTLMYTEYSMKFFLVFFNFFFSQLLAAIATAVAHSPRGSSSSVGGSWRWNGGWGMTGDVDAQSSPIQEEDVSHSW
jgi:hypothetical protein